MEDDIENGHPVNARVGKIGQYEIMKRSAKRFIMISLFPRQGNSKNTNKRSLLENSSIPSTWD